MNETPTIPPRPRLVSVVVVTLNNSRILRSCLQSLALQDYPALETLVVDNGSSEDIAGMIRQEFPAVRLIRLERNTGFAGGNNRGIEQARGDYVALLNNDAVAEPTWISALVSAAEQDSRLGAIGSVVVDGNEPDRLDSFGVGVALDGMSRQAMHGLPAESPGSLPRPVLAVSGCACLFRREALDKAGTFDERFFAYCEDTDLCLRILRSGWDIRVVPEARVTHYYSRTGGKFSLRKVYWVERNHFWVSAKNFPLAVTALLPALTLWRFAIMGRAVLKGIPSVRGFANVRGLIPVLATVAAAQAVALLRIPAMMASRLAFRRRCVLAGWRWLRVLWHSRMTIDEAVTGIGRPPHLKPYGISSWERPDDDKDATANNKG